MKIERRERDLEEKKREDNRKLEHTELDEKKSEEDIRRQQMRQEQKEETDNQLKKLQDLIARDDDPDDGLIGAMDDLMQWPLTSSPISTAWLPKATGPDVQNKYPSPLQVWNVSQYSI